MSLSVPAPDGGALMSPVAEFLSNCHANFAADRSGALADYIPELTKADPDHFGIALATIDGHLHTVGETEVPFTIQSISKAFVYALALEQIGEARVSAIIGVEPSGDAFNSIRLSTHNHPFNPMVNAGAIACTGLLQARFGAATFERIRQTLSDFAGRPLEVDEDVAASEAATGDRNRAIAWLLKTHGVLTEGVDDVLATYFRQCAVVVTARDLAAMGATLANAGVNPLTGRQVTDPATVAKTLSVMVSAGMYDASGTWIYRVGLPAKSGVGGGIVACLPAQLGLGTFSPLLDPTGSSVRGVKVCETLSATFGLHLLEQHGDLSQAVAADYDLKDIRSSRDRRPEEKALLARDGGAARVLELAGDLDFAGADYIARRLAAVTPEFVILDLRRVSAISVGAGRVLAALADTLTDKGTRVILSGLRSKPAAESMVLGHLEEGRLLELRRFGTLDTALAWTEDQIVYARGGFIGTETPIALSEQALLHGLDQRQLDTLYRTMVSVDAANGERIIAEGAPADSVYFLARGLVTIRLSSGVRVASLEAGTCVGEFALINPRVPRTASVVADTACQLYRLDLDAWEHLSAASPDLTQQVLRNLAGLLADRLRQANVKMNALSTR